MNSQDASFHWPDAARRALTEFKATVLDGCGSCGHAGWGALPPCGSNLGAACVAADFNLIVCAKGVAGRDKDGRLEVLRYCTFWNGDGAPAEPPPIPESTPSGGAWFSPARPGLIPLTGR